MSRQDGPLPVPEDWVRPELCDLCGRFHGGQYCPAPVTALPSGLLTADRGLTPLGQVVADAADHLAMRHAFLLAPDEDEWPYWVFAELAAMWPQGPCHKCVSQLWNWKELAHHFMGSKEEEMYRAMPVWTCECGAAYKLDQARAGAGWEFCYLADDGLPGDQAGTIRLDSKHRVKRSDACPACRRSFADTIARRADPQGSLF